VVVYQVCSYEHEAFIMASKNASSQLIVDGIGVFFDTRKGSFRYKISLYIITYHVAIIVYHYVSWSISQYIISLEGT